MSLRLAPSRRGLLSPVGQALSRRRPGLPANDNCFFRTDDSLLEEALGCLAQHGLAAARQAEAQCEQALATGDLDAVYHWGAICLMLDRRRARVMENRAAACGIRPDRRKYGPLGLPRRTAPSTALVRAPL